MFPHKNLFTTTLITKYRLIIEYHKSVGNSGYLMIMVWARGRKGVANVMDAAKK